MPANLTPQYYKAEEEFRNASTIDEKIEALENMLAVIPKHKGTDKLQGDLRKKLSQLKEQGEKQKKKGGRRDPFHVEKSGAGQVILLGTPNVGKSSLVNKMTRAELKVGDYPYTTQLPAPGMIPYEDIYIQLVDAPPITKEMVPSGLVGALRFADIIAIVLGMGNEDLLEQMETVDQLFENRGIVPITASVQETDEMEFEIGYPKPALIIANQSDLDLELEENLAAFRELYETDLEIIPVSAETGEGLDKLASRLFELLDVIRIYSKKPGQDPDLEEPFTIAKGSSIEDLAYNIHRDLPEEMKYARVWGESAKFPGQQLQHSHILADKDIVEIHD